MYCSNCGKEISDNSNFCINCCNNLKNSNMYFQHEEMKVNNKLIIR